MARFLFTTFHNEFCIGVSYLKAVLQREGHRCRMVGLKVYKKNRIDEVPEIPRYTEVHEVWEPDGNWYYFSYPWAPTEKEWDLWLNLIRKEDPQVIGMSIAASHLRTASEAVRRLRAAGVRVPIIWGGPQPTVDPESCLAHADYVCIGEGENVVTAIADAVDRNLPLKDIHSLAYVDGDGSIVKNPPAPTIKDLDTLPLPDWDEKTRFFVESDQVYQAYLPPESNYYGSEYMLFTARGCPYKCSFCINGILHEIDVDGANLRRRSVESVMAELRAVKERFGNVYIQVHDEIFTLNKNWIHDFSVAYKEEIGLPFWCYTHPMCCKEEMIRDLKDAGLRYVIMGIQSGSERLNKEVYHRPTPRKKIQESLWMLDRLDVLTQVDVLSNNPLETEEDLRATATLLNQCPERTVLGVGKVIVYPSSPLYQHVRHLPFPPVVDEKTYEFWNSVYFVALYGGLNETELEILMSDRSLREDPTEIRERAVGYMKESREKAEQRLVNYELALQKQMAGG